LAMSHAQPPQMATYPGVPSSRHPGLFRGADDWPVDSEHPGSMPTQYDAPHGKWSLSRKQSQSWKLRYATPKNIMLVVGTLTLFMIIFVPVWNCFALMQDSNYTFWLGRTVPGRLVSACLFILLLYIVTILIYFSGDDTFVDAEQNLMMVPSIFITLLGLVLMLGSLPLTRQSIDTYNNLMFHCESSVQTHRMYEYSHVLQNIRQQPECIRKYSVKDCRGYEDAAPYTSFLQEMESGFRCSGFCYRPTPGAESSTMNIDKALTLTQKRMVDKRHRGDSIASLMPIPSAVDGVGQMYPPTLFSDDHYQASCEGVAARDIKNFAGDIGYQTFFQGMHLIVIAVAMGFLKLATVFLYPKGG